MTKNRRRRSGSRWGGRATYLEFNSAAPAALVERPIDVGGVASIGSPARDPCIRAVDFLPHAGGVIEEDWVFMTLGMLNGLELPGTTDKDLV